MKVLANQREPTLPTLPTVSVVDSGPLTRLYESLLPGEVFTVPITSQTPELQAVLERLEQLERQNRRLKRAGLPLQRLAHLC